MSGDALAVLLFLASGVIGSMLAAINAPSGWRANLCWSSVAAFALATVLFVLRPTAFPIAATWKFATAISPLLAVLLAVMVVVHPRRGEGAHRTPAASEPKAVAREREERVFVGTGVTPKTLHALFKGKTDLQIERLAAPYLGKWMKVRGKFRNASSTWDGDYSLDIQENPERPYVHVWLGKSWKDRVETLEVGDELAVVGKLGRLERDSISLRECELIPLSDAQDAYVVGAVAPSPNPPGATPKRGVSKSAPRRKGSPRQGA